ncbi:hypothetical protein GCM10011367_18660 [Marinicauda pacifica]|nr:hypothetical protein GCM10011367_18660 [Marinicauda pacifica]
MPKKAPVKAKEISLSVAKWIRIATIIPTAAPITAKNPSILIMFNTHLDLYKRANVRDRRLLSHRRCP